MVTVFTRGRLKIAIYREARGKHHLPHCHVYLLDAETVISLTDFECLANNGFRKKAIKQIQQIVANYQEEFFDIWSFLNGKEK